MDASELSLSQTMFDAWWNETDQYPRSRERCTAANAPRALLTARVETPQVRRARTMGIVAARAGKALAFPGGVLRSR